MDTVGVSGTTVRDRVLRLRVLRLRAQPHGWAIFFFAGIWLMLALVCAVIAFSVSAGVTGWGFVLTGLVALLALFVISRTLLKTVGLLPIVTLKSTPHGVVVRVAGVARSKRIGPLERGDWLRIASRLPHFQSLEKSIWSYQLSDAWFYTVTGTGGNVEVRSPLPIRLYDLERVRDFATGHGVKWTDRTSRPDGTSQGLEVQVVEMRAGNTLSRRLGAAGGSLSLYPRGVTADDARWPLASAWLPAEDNSEVTPLVVDIPFHRTLVFSTSSQPPGAAEQWQASAPLQFDDAAIDLDVVGEGGDILFFASGREPFTSVRSYVASEGATARVHLELA